MQLHPVQAKPKPNPAATLGRQPEVHHPSLNPTQDTEYERLGAQVVDRETALRQDIVITVMPPSMEEAGKIKEHGK